LLALASHWLSRAGTIRGQNIWDNLATAPDSSRMKTKELG